MQRVVLVCFAVFLHTQVFEGAVVLHRSCLVCVKFF